MTRNVAVLAYDLAVAVISILLFAATLVWLATHQISSFHAIFLLIGSTLASVLSVFSFQSDKEPWPIRIFADREMPAQKTVRPSLIDSIRSLDWTGRAQGA